MKSFLTIFSLAGRHIPKNISIPPTNIKETIGYSDHPINFTPSKAKHIKNSMSNINAPIAMLAPPKMNNFPRFT